MLKDVGVVILNYLTHDETKETLSSLKDHYPEIRTVIVDNGSPVHVVEKLYDYASFYGNVSILPLKNNIGFARGNNAGINLLRNEGYNYICCSNNDIVIPQRGVLESLKAALMEPAVAIAGPRVIGNDGKDQNPLRITRPDDAEAKAIANKYNANTFVKKRIQKAIKKPKKLLIKFLKSFISKDGYFSIKKNSNTAIKPEKQFVYSLRGCFIMMGKNFFNCYNGFDENTFLYYEESILAEMLLACELKTVFIPDFYIFHKESRTMKFVFGKTKRKRKEYARQAAIYWYHNCYLKNYKAGFK